MIKFIIIVLSILLLLFLTLAVVHCKKSNRMIKDAFKNNNVIVFGAKGKGKDLLFQKSIYLTRDKHYLSNTDYGYNFNNVTIQELNIDPNTYDNFIKDKVIPIKKRNDWEGLNAYISDVGVYLPSQYDHLLHKTYPSFPIFYALSRHMYNMNIHMNTQSLDRPWKAIREQGDKYIWCVKKLKLFGIIICKIIIYDKYQSAYNRLLPLNSRFFNKYSKAETDQYNSTNGQIDKRYYIIKTKHIKYDTRHFHQVIFNVPFMDSSVKEIEESARLDREVDSLISSD